MTTEQRLLGRLQQSNLGTDGLVRALCARARGGAEFGPTLDRSAADFILEFGWWRRRRGGRALGRSTRFRDG